jgi:hypothetical protein
MSQAIIWIDHKEARIFKVDPGATEHSVINSPGRHIHRHANEQDLRVRNHPDDEHRFFEEVARALDGAEQLLLVGPSKTKLHFLRYAQQHERALESRIIGVESADHPTDAQLVAHMRHYFGQAAPRPGVHR